MGCGVEPIHRPAGLVGRLPAVRSGRGDRLASLLHAQLSCSERGTDLGGNQGVLAARLLICSRTFCTPSSMAACSARVDALGSPGSPSCSCT